jgi:hypothetical protein
VSLYRYERIPKFITIIDFIVSLLFVHDSLYQHVFLVTSYCLKIQFRHPPLHFQLKSRAFFTFQETRTVV